MMSLEKIGPSPKVTHLHPGRREHAYAEVRVLQTALAYSSNTRNSSNELEF
jgi:hypothetical protein